MSAVTITAARSTPFGHPIRAQAYRVAIRDGLVTPRDLAREIGLPTENVAYHVGVLVDHGLLRLKDTVPVRGAVSHRYEPAGDASALEGEPATPMVVTAETDTDQLEGAMSDLAAQALAARSLHGPVRVTCLIEPLAD